MDKLEQSSRAYLKRKASAKDASVATDDRALQKIRDDFKRAMEMGDEKIELAAQTYELVDKHIRRLDADLKKFEAELEQQGAQSRAAAVVWRPRNAMQSHRNSHPDVLSLVTRNQGQRQGHQGVQTQGKRQGTEEEVRVVCRVSCVSALTLSLR